MLRLAVLASGRGSNLHAILRHMSQGRIEARIALVLSNVPDAPALEIAKAAGIPTWAQSHKKFPNRAAYDGAMLDAMRAAGVDAVVLAGYMRLLSPTFIQAYPNKILNVHPSLLPAFPGANGGGDTLTYGAMFAGCTVHFVTQDMDAGPIVIQAALPVRQGENEESLMPRIHALEHRIYPQAVQWLAQGRLRVIGRTVRLLPAPGNDAADTSHFTDRPYNVVGAGSLGSSLAIDCLINPPLDPGF